MDSFRSARLLGVAFAIAVGLAVIAPAAHAAESVRVVGYRWFRLVDSGKFNAPAKGLVVSRDFYLIHPLRLSFLVEHPSWRDPASVGGADSVPVQRVVRLRVGPLDLNLQD